MSRGAARASTPGRFAGSLEARFPEPDALEGRLARHADFLGPAFEGEGAYLIIQSPDPEAMERLPRPRRPKALADRWLDPGWRVEEILWQTAVRHHAADSIPVAFPDFGCGNLTAMLGAGYRLEDETIWFDAAPLARNLETLPPLALDRVHPFYLAIKATVSELAERSSGSFAVGATDIGSNLDVLSGLIPRVELLKNLVALKGRAGEGEGRPLEKNGPLEKVGNLEKIDRLGKIDHLEKVGHLEKAGHLEKVGPLERNDRLEKIDHLERALAGINRAWLELLSDHHEWIASKGAALSSFNQVVFRGLWYKLMSESSIMISPKSFEAKVLPSIQWQVDKLERSIFNIDGLGQAHLVAPVLRLENLSAVEWNPVPQLDPARGVFAKDYLSENSLAIARAVQAAGRKLIVTKVPPLQVMPLLKALSPDGLLLTVEAADPGEADRLEALTRGFRRWSP